MLRLVRTTSADSDFQQLISGLDQELWARYDQEQEKYAVYNQVDELAKVVVAYEGHIALGCGCFKPATTNGAMEVKRMYVQSGARGKGIARKILQELENWAKELQYSSAILETGTRQPEAIALYQKCGYTQIENYGPYQNLPESVCFGKSLEQ